MYVRGPAFSGGTTALVAKGLSKIRKKGSLGRYIHGGATLQELAIPVLRINKTRQDDARRVDVSVLASSTITSPSITLKFYQDEPAGGKILPHRIAAWFESLSGEVLSNKGKQQRKRSSISWFLPWKAASGSRTRFSSLIRHLIRYALPTPTLRQENEKR
jgi:hypothetical protein